MKTKTLLPNITDPETRIAIAEALIALLQKWEVHEINQAALLDLSNTLQLSTRKLVTASDSTMERAGHLLAIDRALLKRFPYQPESHKRWVHTPRSDLQNDTPLRVMLEDGLQGIQRVRELAESVKD